MTITGSNTTNFSFQKLGSNDDAGYSTINEVVDSIDSQLNNSDRLLKSGLTPTTGYTLKWDGSDWISGTLDSVGITNLAVITSKIADGAVTTDKINDSAVTSAKIADGTIVNADINSSAGIVDTKLATISTAGKVANSATTASSANGNDTIVARDSAGNFAADTITASSFVGTATRASNLGGGSGGSVPYQSAANTTAMLANGTAGQVLTSNGTTLAPSWQAASIGNSNIATNAITQDKMADDSVGTAEIINSNVTTAKIADGNVTTIKIADSNVTYAKLGDDVKYYQTAVVVTTSGASARTFSLTDSNRKFIEYNVATTGGTFTVPPSSSVNFPVGAEIHLLQTNTGQLTIAAGAGVTINATPGLKLRTQWSSATLIKRATDTWILVGDLVA